MSTTPYELHRSLRHTHRLGSLAEKVYTVLRERIIAGVLAPNARLIELEIAAEFGTSQGPVRETLQMLEQEGLLERRSGRTMHVTEVSAHEVHGFSIIRSKIEEIAIQRTAQQISDDQVRVFEDLVRAMQLAGQQDDLKTLVGYDMEFHRLICYWSGSSVLVGSWMPLYSQIQRFILQTHPRYFATLTELAETHLPILSALQDRDGERGAACIREHIDMIWNWLDDDSIN